MSLSESRSYPTTQDTTPPKSINSEPREILTSRTLSFTQYTPFFEEVFQSPGATFLTYNPSAAFINPPDLYRAVRVDCSEGDRTKSIIFRYGANGDLEPYPERTFDLEDPFATNIDGEIIFGGVQVDKTHNAKGEIASQWRTILYRGKTIPELKPFFTGPEGMKDIRPVKLPSGRIGIYTRPRDLDDQARGGEGQIGYKEFDSLDQLESATPSTLDIENAPLLSFRFPRGEWGGVNHVQVVKGGQFKDWNVPLIHRAYRDTVRHYLLSALLHDPETGQVVDLGILLKRSDLPPGPWKGQKESRDLEDVIFPAELILEEGRIRIIAGASDAEIVEVEKPIPSELVSLAPNMAVRL